MEEEEDMPYPLLVEAVSYEAWGDNLKELTRLGFDIRAPEGGRFKPRVHILTIRTVEQLSYITQRSWVRAIVKDGHITLQRDAPAEKTTPAQGKKGTRAWCPC